MAIPTFNAVGFCAHYSPQGDWAFDYALRLSEQHALQLNVFHFLEDPYDPGDHSAEGLSREERAREAIAKERELRLYYDKRAGDYLNVGFRLCERSEWHELHRCLLVREFQVLVLGYPAPPATFAGKPIEVFADSFICPVILVGPDHRDQLHLNTRAALLAHTLGLPEGRWNAIQRISA
jgi:hypothetical protein